MPQGFFRVFADLVAAVAAMALYPMKSFLTCAFSRLRSAPKKSQPMQRGEMLMYVNRREAGCELSRGFRSVRPLVIMLNHIE